MRLEIYSLKNILFEGEATSVNCKTAMGELTILESHKPLISMLEEGPVKVTSSSGEEIFAVKGGFMQVSPNHEVRMLVEE